MRAALLAISLFATPALAQDVAPFDQLVDESIGYVTLDDGIVLIEDSISSTICKVDVSDAFFFAYQSKDAGAMAAARPEVVCVPTPAVVADALTAEDGGAAFDILIDQSIGYVSLAPGRLLVESETGSHICRVQIDDVYFMAHASGDDGRRRSAAPVIICVPTGTVVR